MRKQHTLQLLAPVCILFSVMAIFSGCQREVESTIGNSPTPGVNDNVMVTAGMRGTVIDENGNPVNGATVTSGTQTTTTDHYGVFRFSNISMSKNNAYVKVTKTGYFTGMRTFVATAGRTHIVRIRLLPKTNTGTFSGTAGGTISLAGGGKLVMPANAVVDGNGAAYTGTVNIAMTWIDPSSPLLSEIVVGDLRGITTSGEERGLETFGMLGVEMTTPGGQALKIATGKTAELTFPIPASLSANAPATIDLWHFDETKGRWMQEGSATKAGTNYIAQVSHFSFWNTDAPFPLFDLCMTLQNAANNQPLNNVQVRIVRSNGSYGTGWTDSLGNLCGKVPQNEPFTLQVLDQCNTVAYSQNVGPLNANTNLGIISVVLPAANTLVITGNVTNCSNNPVTNGVVIVYAGNNYSYSVPVNNGAFSFTMIRCTGSGSIFSVKAIDLATLQESQVYNGTGSTGTVTVGTLQACGSYTEFIEYIVDGVPVHWVDLGNPNTITAYDSTGVAPYSSKTGLYGQWVVNNNVEATYFWFYHNGTTGSYPLLNSGTGGTTHVNNQAGLLGLQNFTNPNPTINITSFGPIGGYIEGNFNESMNVGGATPIVQVVCNFKVKR